MGLVTDEIDMNIVNLVNSYKEALYNLIEFNTQDNFDLIQQLRNEEI